MEKIDFWKRYPCIFVGQGAGKDFFPSDLQFSLEKILEQPSQMFRANYFFLPQETKDFHHIVSTLLEKGCSSTQIFYLSQEPTKPQTNIGERISLLIDESADEFKIRLQHKLEAVRQNVLHHALKKIIGTEHNPSFSQRAFDRARLAHSLSIAFRLNPSDHNECIELAINYEQKNEGRWNNSLLIAPWSNDSLNAQLLVDICELALRNNLNAGFRQSYRLASTNLGFKFRSDLIRIVEICFQHIWGDSSHAA